MSPDEILDPNAARRWIETRLGYGVAWRGSGEHRGVEFLRPFTPRHQPMFTLVEPLSISKLDEACTVYEVLRRLTT